MRVFLLFLLMTSASGAALAQNYTWRWVDEKGQVHYTQTPPPKGTRGSVLGPAVAPQSAPNQDAINKSLADEKRDQPLKQAQAEQDAAEKEARRKQCGEVAEQLAALSAETANRLRVTDEEYAARKGELEAFLAKNCR